MAPYIELESDLLDWMILAGCQAASVNIIGRTEHSRFLMDLLDVNLSGECTLSPRLAMQL